MSNLTKNETILEENDDELNQLYAHYNVVKKNPSANYRKNPEFQNYRKLRCPWGQSFYPSPWT